MALIYSACNPPTQLSDDKPNLMSVTVNDTLYNLTNVGGVGSSQGDSYGGQLGTKQLSIYINRWDPHNQNDTSWFRENKPGFNFVEFDSTYGRSNFGLFTVTGSSKSGQYIRIEGTFFFDIITQQETLRFRNGHINTYVVGYD